MEDRDIIRRVRQRPQRDISDKSWNYAFYRQGGFGNKPRIWDNPEQIYQSGWEGGVCIRDTRGTQRGERGALLPKFNIPLEELPEILKKLQSKGIPLDAMTFNQSMPNNHLSIQGEVTRGTNGILYLTYSHLRKPMRTALSEKTLLAEGLRANLLLKEFLWPPSLEEIKQCLDYFSTGSQTPSPTVEFSSFRVPVGDTPGRNTVIWEVRNY